MTCGIYAIINKTNGKTYIGQSINIEKRFDQHCWGRNKNSGIDKDINEFGKDNFEFKIICECPEKDLNIEEKKFINLYGTFQQGYNLTTGGNSGTRKHHTVKEKMSKSTTQTGFLNVQKKAYKSSPRGFIWSYRYHIDMELCTIDRMNLDDLQEVVIQKGFPWKIVDEKKALISLKENEEFLSNLDKGTNTGFLGVSKIPHKRVKQGFIYKYNEPYNPNRISCSFGSVSFEKLRKKVIGKGLPWKLVDVEKARSCGLV